MHENSLKTCREDWVVTPSVFQHFEDIAGDGGVAGLTNIKILHGRTRAGSLYWYHISLYSMVIQPRNSNGSKKNSPLRKFGILMAKSVLPKHRIFLPNRDFWDSVSPTLKIKQKKFKIKNIIYSCIPEGTWKNRNNTKSLSFINQIVCIQDSFSLCQRPWKQLHRHIGNEGLTTKWLVHPRHGTSWEWWLI